MPTSRGIFEFQAFSGHQSRADTLNATSEKPPSPKVTMDFRSRGYVRTQVLVRAKRMLAAALQEERTHLRAGCTETDPLVNAKRPAPGNGAWWLF